MEGLVQHAAGILNKEEKKDIRETIRSSWLDNMSRMGGYMSTAFATTHGGVSEIEVMKQQKDILQ